MTAPIVSLGVGLISALYLLFSLWILGRGMDGPPEDDDKT